MGRVITPEDGEFYLRTNAEKGDSDPDRDRIRGCVLRVVGVEATHVCLSVFEGTQSCDPGESISWPAREFTQRYFEAA